MKEVILEMLHSHKKMREKRMLVKTDSLFYEKILGKRVSLQFEMTIRAVQMALTITMIYLWIFRITSICYIKIGMIELELTKLHLVNNLMNLIVKD